MEFRNYLEKILDRDNLTAKEAEDLMQDIMHDKLLPTQIAAFLAAMRVKEPAKQELIGMAMAMLDNAENISVNLPIIADTCGTGGDLGSTFNISTISALVVACAKVPVAKHGNRAISSHCGSADLLEMLGIRIDLEASKIEKCIKETNFGFLFAPIVHQAMKFVRQPRQDLGVKTVFNLLGPLTNPARPTHQLLGVYDDNLLRLMINSLQGLGTKRALVVHAKDGLDEISISSNTKVLELKENGSIINYELSYQDFGVSIGYRDEIVCTSREENKIVSEMILQGKDISSRHDAVLMNSGALLYLVGKASSWKEGANLAREILLSGQAWKKLQEVIEFSNS